MIGPELQLAIVAALRAAPALCGGRIYDRVPEAEKRVALTGAAFPYITIGDDQIVDAGNTCAEAWEVFADVHVWSRPDAGSKLEVKTLAAAVDARLNTILVVTGFTVVIAALESSRTFRDPDGLTEHSVLTFRYVLDPA